MADLSIENILRHSYDFALQNQHEFVSTEHILLSIVDTDDDLVHAVCEECGINVDDLKAIIIGHFQEEKYDGTLPQGFNPRETEMVRKILNRATAAAKLQDREIPLPIDLLLAIIIEEETPASYFLRNYTSKEEMSQLLLSLIEDEFEEDSEENTTEDEDKKKKTRQERLEARHRKILQQFAENMNELVNKGKIDPIIGRDNEVREVTKILARRKKNNVILVGEEGVGKTAIAEGMAYRIVNNQVSYTLKNAVVYNLNVQALLAGAKYRGEFEERLKAVIDALKFIVQEGKENPILFIDEIHTIKGAGTGSESTLDMSNMLKPALNAGLRCIGSTTHTEYRKAFDKDRALARRFHKITVDEPSIEDTKAILRGLAPYFEEYHNIRYTEEAVTAAVDLSAKYIKDKKLPDKAIDIIDSAAANYRTSITEEKAETVVDITLEMIENEVSTMAKIPPSVLSEREESDLSTLETRIKKFVYGQDSAVENLVDNYMISKAGLRNQNKTIGSFLFAGPTGTGKTETARQLAHELHIPFIKFDMSEYMEKHSVAKIIGSPPGYIGYDEEGLLIKEIEEKPHCVLLLDEIEKAHPDVFNILLQIMDDGRLTNSKGKTIHFNNVILIMTTNAGASESQKGRIGFGENSGIDLTKQLEAIEKQFKPEFRNRLDSMVMFDPLSEEVIMLVVDKFIDELRALVQDKHIKIEISKAAKRKLREMGYDEKMGARPMEKIIHKHIKKPMAQEILFGKLSNGGKVKIDIIGDEFHFFYDVQKEMVKV